MDGLRDERRSSAPSASAGASRQQLLRRRPGTQRPVRPNPEPEETIVTQCNRCDKDFVQKKAADQQSARGRVGRVPRLFKLCEHCREMGKGRSRRWQMRTKEHGGLCRRCGVVLGADDGQYVLCVKCRQAFRDRKLRRINEGKCISCCEPMKEEDMEDAPGRENVVKRRCRKCRELRQSQPQTKPFTSEFIQSMYKP
ncbi:hypothetical protein OXX79_009713 [Metschnikowia pulcherrima]